jgi:hypothetical protein
MINDFLGVKSCNLVNHHQCALSVVRAEETEAGRTEENDKKSQDSGVLTEIRTKDLQNTSTNVQR